MPNYAPPPTFTFFRISSFSPEKSLRILASSAVRAPVPHTVQCPPPFVAFRFRGPPLPTFRSYAELRSSANLHFLSDLLVLSREMTSFSHVVRCTAPCPPCSVFLDISRRIVCFVDGVGEQGGTLKCEAWEVWKGARTGCCLPLLSNPSLFPSLLPLLFPSLLRRVTENLFSFDVPTPPHPHPQVQLYLQRDLQKHVRLAAAMPLNLVLRISSKNTVVRVRRATCDRRKGGNGSEKRLLDLYIN